MPWLGICGKVWCTSGWKDKEDLQTLEIKTQMFLLENSTLHQKLNVIRLYKPQKEDRWLIGIEECRAYEHRPLEMNLENDEEILLKYVEESRNYSKETIEKKEEYRKRI